ncbi:MAG: carboxypeptidase-like regulatory domain-containing protein [Sphingobacteriia bacterium]|nr:carboxypeptidase-like regulatory domain-containing protein [Sphingobacteriia bacterium]
MLNVVVFFRLLKFKWILGVLLLGIFQGALGQALYKITGQVSDAETGEVLAFCRIKLDSTSFGSTSNDEGRFSILVPPGKYTLVTYFVGYKPVRLPIEITNKSIDSLHLKLALADMVEEIVITGKAVNPAHRIIRNAIAHRKDNSFEKIEAYEYSAYNKMVISMDKITDEFLNQRLLRKAGTVLNSIKQDSVVKDSDAYKLAVFVSETSTRAYFYGH